MDAQICLIVLWDSIYLAFVTFNTRLAETISVQMKLDHDSMKVNHAPNPHDIIWENIAIPYSQVCCDNYYCTP